MKVRTLWRRLRLPDAASFRGWTIDANHGIIATAGLLQGFSGAGAKWAEEAAEREAQLRLAAQESDELLRNTDAELDELTELWRARGLSPATARTVAEELTAHDAIGAHLDAEYGIDEVMPHALPIWAGVTGAIAYMLGAAIPLLITWLFPVTIETWAIVGAVVASLVMTSLIAARARHLSLRGVLTRSLVVGLGTMGISYLGGLVLF